ncbi:MAG: hypothetical protein KatS3mg119_2210 [Rhodothalassiaceae bacterium]|nr:MAG: hypothetical protein KatS3mg119_2210 [Rhodothalassiaceae bacterium]
MGLHDAGVLDRRTLREFDALCLTPIPDMPPERIRAIRLREGVSQAVFARYLNISKGSSASGSAAKSGPAARP